MPLLPLPAPPAPSPPVVPGFWYSGRQLANPPAVATLDVVMPPPAEPPIAVLATPNPMLAQRGPAAPTVDAAPPSMEPTVDWLEPPPAATPPPLPAPPNTPTTALLITPAAVGLNQLDWLPPAP